MKKNIIVVCLLLITGLAKSQNNATSKPLTDFVPGAAVIFSDNFEKDAINDFPAGWNTNGSGQVVTLDGKEGKWLEI